LPRNTSSTTFEPAAPRNVRRHVTCGLVVDRADEVAGAKTGLGRRRPFTCGHDPQVILPNELDPDIRRTGARVGFEGANEVGCEEGAVGIERVGHAAHRAAHRLLQIHFLDVVVDDVRDDVIEHPEVLIGVVLRQRLAEISAHQNEHDDRRRYGENPKARTSSHQQLRCGGITEASAIVRDPSVYRRF
jgi:hypothetical protein